MGVAPGPPSIPPSLLLDPHLPPYSTLAFDAHLQDLACRFIVNLPADELSSIERICFQVEQAHWFYEDFLRPLNPTLPSMNLRKFSTHLLSTSAQIVPLIRHYLTASTSSSAALAAGGSAELELNLEKAFDDFLKYKTRVPVCGVIMLDERWEKCLLVKGWKASSAWGFPKGKINQSETTRDCAVREVYEETGFDCGEILPPDSPDYLELTMREQKIRLYVVPGVSEDTHFEPMTRKEISKIAWWRLRDLPAWKHNSGDATGHGKFYSVAPFAARLKTWILHNRKTHARRPAARHGAAFDLAEAAHAIEEDGDEAEAVQAEQTRQLLDRLFAPVPVPTAADSASAMASGEARSDPSALPQGPALLDYLFGKPAPSSAPAAPSVSANAQASGGPSSAPSPQGQSLLNILLGNKTSNEASGGPPGAPPPQGQSLLNILLGPNKSNAPLPTGPALLDHLFGRTAPAPAPAPAPALGPSALPAGPTAPVPPPVAPTPNDQALLSILLGQPNTRPVPSSSQPHSAGITEINGPLSSSVAAPGAGAGVSAQASDGPTPHGQGLLNILLRKPSTNASAGQQRSTTSGQIGSAPTASAQATGAGQPAASGAAPTAQGNALLSILRRGQPLPPGPTSHEHARGGGNDGKTPTASQSTSAGQSLAQAPSPAGATAPKDTLLDLLHQRQVQPLNPASSEQRSGKATATNKASPTGSSGRSASSTAAPAAGPPAEQKHTILSILRRGEPLPSSLAPPPPSAPSVDKPEPPPAASLPAGSGASIPSQPATPNVQPGTLLDILRRGPVASTSSVSESEKTVKNASYPGTTPVRAARTAPPTAGQPTAHNSALLDLVRGPPSQPAGARLPGQTLDKPAPAPTPAAAPLPTPLGPSGQQHASSTGAVDAAPTPSATLLDILRGPPKPAPSSTQPGGGAGRNGANERQDLLNLLLRPVPAPGQPSAVLAGRTDANSSTGGPNLSSGNSLLDMLGTGAVRGPGGADPPPPHMLPTSKDASTSSPPLARREAHGQGQGQGQGERQDLLSILMRPGVQHPPPPSAPALSTSASTTIPTPGSTANSTNALLNTLFASASHGGPGPGPGARTSPSSFSRV